MTRLERYRQQLAELEGRRSQLMRQGRYMQMYKLNSDIEEIKALIAEAEQYEAKPIKELLGMDKINESGIIPALIECHLVADYLTACTYTVNDIIKKLGFQPVSVIPELKEIISKSSSFASQLCDKSEILSNMLTDNDTLLEALHKKTMSYIFQRINPKQKSKAK